MNVNIYLFISNNQIEKIKYKFYYKKKIFEINFKLIFIDYINIFN